MDFRQILRKNGLEAQGGEITERHWHCSQRHRRDTKAKEGEITHIHFRRIKGELTDQKRRSLGRRSQNI